MILYNVTVNIETGVLDDWLDWMQNKHIPDVLNTGLFLDYKLFRILNNTAEEGVTYCIQYYLADMDDYNTYQEKHASALQAEHTTRYKGRFVAFRTLMELVDQGDS